MQIRIRRNYTALLDTGTYFTLVGQGVLDDLGLNLITPDEIISNFRGANGVGDVKVYHNIPIILPQNKQLNITIHCSGQYYRKGDNPTPFSIAIGMDILNKGIFCINGANKEYTLCLPD